MPLEKKLKDVLEDEVDEKYYLSGEQVASFKVGQSAEGQLHSGVVGRVEAINGHDILKRVYGAGGVSPTLSTMEGGNREPKIVASRGRGEPPVQHLEPRKDGLTNTITSVEKDNYLAEPGVKIIDDIYKNRPPRVYPKTAPTIRAAHAGDLKVVRGHDSDKDS